MDNKKIVEEIRIIREVLWRNPISDCGPLHKQGYTEGKISAAICLLNALEDELTPDSSMESDDDFDGNERTVV